MNNSHLSLTPLNLDILDGKQVLPTQIKNWPESGES
jgi:hypothetical protein